MIAVKVFAVIMHGFPILGSGPGRAGIGQSVEFDYSR
jgi:hypothetical protein